MKVRAHSRRLIGRFGLRLIVVVALAALLATSTASALDYRQRSAENARVSSILGAAEKVDEVATQLLNFVDKVQIAPEPEPGEFEDESVDLAEDIASARQRLATVVTRTDVDVSGQLEILDDVEGLVRAAAAGSNIVEPSNEVARDLFRAAELLIARTDAPLSTELAAARAAAVELHGALTSNRAEYLRSYRSGRWPDLMTQSALAQHLNDAVSDRYTTYLDQVASVKTDLAGFADSPEDAARMDWALEPALFRVTAAPTNVDYAEWVDETQDSTAPHRSVCTQQRRDSYLYLAALRAGISSVPVNFHLTVEEAGFIFEDPRPPSSSRVLRLWSGLWPPDSALERWWCVGAMPLLMAHCPLRLSLRRQIQMSHRWNA